MCLRYSKLQGLWIIYFRVVQEIPWHRGYSKVRTHTVSREVLCP